MRAIRHEKRAGRQPRATRMGLWPHPVTASMPRDILSNRIPIAEGEECSNDVVQRLAATRALCALPPP